MTTLDLAAHEEAVQGPMTDYGPGSSNGRPGDLKVAHGRVWDGDSSMGGGTGTHDTLWTWQQHEEVVQGPMTDYGPGSSM
ncbi:unnamed protein product, partial [Staurois parvus]